MDKDFLSKQIISLLLIFSINICFSNVISNSYVQLLNNSQKRGEEFYHIFQDSKGFIWFCTDMGLIRYDGYNLRYFTIADGLPDNTVFELFEDEKNRLWGRTFNGKIFYIYNNIVFSNITLNNHLISISNQKEIKSLVVKNDKIYIGYLNNKQLIIDIYPSLKAKFLNSKYNGIYIYEIDSVLFTKGVYRNKQSTDGIVLFNRTNGIIKNISVPKQKLNTASSSRLLKINNNYLLMLIDAIFYFNTDSILFSQDDKGYVTGAYADGTDIYIGIRNSGVFKTLLTPDSLIFVEKIIDDFTPNIFIDNEKNMWIATREDGVFYLPYFKFQLINIGLFSKETDVIKIEKFDAKTLLIGLANGQFYSFDGTQIKALNNLNFYLDKAVKDYRFLNTNDSILLVGSRKNNTGHISYYLNKKKYMDIDSNLGSIKDIVYNPNDSAFYIAQHDKLSKLTIRKKGAYKLDTLVLGRVNTVAALESYIFYGTHHGLWMLYKKNARYNKKILIRNQRINILQPISDSIIIAATHGNGLIVLGENIYYTLKDKTGLINNIVNCLLYDDKRQTLWVGTPAGLSRVIFENNFKKFVIQNYTINSGLTANIVNDLEIISDTLYVACKKDITIIPLNNLPLKIPNPKIILNSQKVNNIELPLNKDNLHLKYNQRDITLSFDVISYSFSQNMVLHYRKIPKDTLWKEISGKTLNFENFNYGTYYLEIKACTKDGISCSDSFVKKITITPPFWYQWWFISLILILTPFLIYIFINQRIRTTKHKYNIKRQLFEAEKKALRAQMNPHFIFNALASIQNYIINNDVEKADYYIGLFAKLIRNILESTKNINIALNKEIETIKLYLELEKMRLNNLFDFSIETNNISDIDNVEIPSMLIQPIVENAVWHGIAHLADRRGMIKISFYQELNHIKCVIEDNGIGRENAQKHKMNELYKTSMGFKITEKRIQLDNKKGSQISINDIKAPNGDLVGTNVTILI